MSIFRILTKLKNKLAENPWLWSLILVGSSMFLIAWVLGLFLQVLGSAFSMGASSVKAGPFSCLWVTLSKGLVIYLVICIALIVLYFISYKKLMGDNSLDERGFKSADDGLYGTSKYLTTRELSDKGFIVTDDIEMIDGYILGYKEEDDDV